MIPRRLWPGLLALLGATSCAEGGADFHVKSEPGFTEGPTTISVFGVFHKGRMSPESWAQIGPPLSATLGQKACEVAYGDKLAGESPELYAAVDESVKNEGITEELLERVAPSAQGDLILVVSMNGHTTISRGEDGPSQSGSGAPQPGRGRGGGGGGRTRGGGQGQSTPRGRGAETSELEISGTLFSVSRRRSVARLNMVYAGSNLDDAIGKFVHRIGTMVPGSSCKGWRWGSAAAP
jgi:hypothetical protein